MDLRLRVVLDTNVLISAAMKPAGLQAVVIYLLALGAAELYASQEVLIEYREVFNRPKFAHLDPANIFRLLSQIEGQAIIVKPTTRLAISKHDSDNRFYECAEAALADYIVTGNLRHFSMSHKTTQIITSRQFIELVTGQKNFPHDPLLPQ